MANRESKTGKSKERVLISFDYALKRLLRNKANYDVLEGFLSELLMRDVKVQNIVESESNREQAKDKSNKVDVLVEDMRGELMLVELQFAIEIDYFHRMLYGTSKIITEYMKRGDEYLNVRKVYSINIVYFDLGQGADYVYHGRTVFTGLHTSDELQLSASQRRVFGGCDASDIYPEYYILKVNLFNDVAKDTLDEWIYFLKHNAIREEFTAKGLDKAREVLEYDRLSPSERAEYDYLQDVRSENLSMVASVKDETRTEYDAIIAEKDTVIAEKESALAEKESALARERAEKEALLAELAALKNKNNS